MIPRIASPALACDPDALSAVLGPIRRITRAPLTTVGFTSAHRERVDVERTDGSHVALVIKRTNRSGDWMAHRTHDHVGRETAQLGEPALARVWDAFDCPYVAWAADDDASVLIMRDLTPHLLPDVREPLSPDVERRLLSALATLHAAYWESPALALPWLTQPADTLGMLDACCAADPQARAMLPESLRDGFVRGWAAAIARMPPAIATLMTAPAHELAWMWEGLPETLLHGDTKVANFALLPEGAVAAFDWAMIGRGPVALDLGWYVAVNATRLAVCKEHTLAQYRAQLEAALGRTLPDATWARLERAAAFAGARMLLWSKALAVEAGRPGADVEWKWWMARLDALLRAR